MSSEPILETAEEEQIQESIEENIGLINAAVRSGRIPPREMAEVLRRALETAAQQVEGQVLEQFTAGELNRDYWTQVKKRRDAAPTGFSKLDDALGGGLEAQRLKVILGAPGSGKTTFTNQLVTNIADSGRPVFYVTSEDSPFTLLAKTLSRIGDVNYTAVLKGWENAAEKINAALRIHAEKLSTERLRYLDASNGVGLDSIKKVAVSHFEMYREDGGQGVLVIDYLQRMARAQRGNTLMELRQRVTQLTEELRVVAKELDCCVIALASQNRASGYGASNGSALSSAKESGDIEYTADVIMSLAEDKRDAKNGRQQKMVGGSSVVRPWLLCIDKNRLGQNDLKIELDWRADRQQFTTVEER